MRCIEIVYRKSLCDFKEDSKYLLRRDSVILVQMVRHLPATQETWVQSLGWEDPLEKEMATQFSTLAWKIPWTEEPGRLQSMWSQRVKYN